MMAGQAPRQTSSRKALNFLGPINVIKSGPAEGGGWGPRH
jgi:hypothetical protein